jgi:CRP/FNR family transcriptional regulator, cyclic AMP receptor protein
VRWELFEGLAPGQVNAVLSAARRRQFKRGEIIFHEGDSGDALYLVASGHAAVRVATPYGDTATLRVIGPGEFFGELAVISPSPRAATVAALEGCDTLVLHREQMNTLREQSPAVDRALLDAVVRQVRHGNGRVLDAMFVPTSKRLARRLVELAKTYQPAPDGTITIPLTQDDLAGLCGATRPTVNQLLGKLLDRGLLEVSRGRVRILNLAELTRMAG